MSSRFDGHACPTWVRYRRNRPTDYNRLYDELKEFNGTVKTERISCLLQKSGLQSQQLDRIWNLINNKTSYLSEQEFCILIAFVALSQKGTHVFDVKTLFKLVQPPAVPEFNKTVPLGQSNAFRHNQSQASSQGQMYSFINQSQITDSFPDDEFSEFQSGLTTSAVPDQTIEPETSHLTSQFPQKVIPFSPVHMYSNSKPEAGTDVGSRLANYDLGYTQDSQRKPISTNNFDSLIGEEDKYSAFRVFLKDEQNPAPAPVSVIPNSASQIQSGDLDFGDFQSFTDATATNKTVGVGGEEFSSWTGASIPAPALPIPAVPNPTNPFSRPNFNPNPVQIKLEETQVDFSDDFGEFVTFTDNQTSISSTTSDTFKPVASEPSTMVNGACFPVLTPMSVFPSFDITTSNAALPTLNSNKETLLEHDLNSLDLTNTTYDFTSQSQPVGIQDSPIPKPRSGDHGHGGGLNFPFDLSGSSKMNLQLKTTKIGNSNTDDPFDEFTSFESSEIRNNIHGGGSSGGATNMDLRLSMSAYEIKLKHSSPETQSVCSLDLGNYGGWELTENRKSTENIDSDFPRSENQSSKNSSVFSSGDGNDKYNCFKEELEITKSRCITAWKRCLRVCVRLIESAVTIFNSVSSSDILRQVISSEKGHLYVLSLREVYLVACRIYHSWIKLSADETAGSLHRKLALAWDSFVPFLMGTDLEDHVNQSSLISEDDLTDSTNVCGICLIGTKGMDNFDEDSSLLLDYGGSLYHLACANLWVNEVDSVLPSLYK